MSIVHRAQPLTDLPSIAAVSSLADPVSVPAETPTVVATTAEERGAALEAIANEVRVCTLCPLHVGRTNAVPGEGHPDTEVIFVGEGPGFNEDQQGRPFVGAAGKFLTELIESIGWQRRDVFITNVVKCRPPGNRDPEPNEIATCAPYLHRQLEVLDPALVVTLGRFSMQSFMPGARIGQVHGTVQPVDPATGARHARAYAMYHPASAFRQQALRQTIELDMTGLPRALIDARDVRPRPQQAPGRLPVDEPPPTAPDPDPQPIPVDEPPPTAPDPDRQPTPIDDPLMDPEPVPAPLPAGATARSLRDDDQMSLF